MARWGSDGVTCASRTGAVLGLANLAITPESLHETSPVWDAALGRLFTAAARLDNREELCERFGIPQAERASLADGTLVRASCRSWGEEAPLHLRGDWAFAEWDEPRCTLRLSRDQLGVTGLYYCHRPPWFAFASDPQALFALHWMGRRINELKVASYLAVFPFAGEDETCWQEVFRLLPGRSLQVSPEAMHSKQYWDVGQVAPLPGRTDDEYVEDFMERFQVAVSSRLRSRFPIGVALSAGLDSGAVAALAARALAEENRTLAAFTAVPLFPAAHLAPGALADEWPLAQAVARWYPNINHYPIDAAAVTPLQGIAKALAIHHAPQHAAVNEYWIMALHEAARERGIGVMLNGQLGNGGVSWSGGRDRIFCLFASGKWDEGRRAMTQWRRRHGRSWIGAVAECLVKPVLRPYWPPVPRRLWRILPPWSEIAAIHPDFAARLNLAQTMRAGNSVGAIEPARERRETLVRNGMMAGPIWHAQGAAFGMEVRDPTADVRLLDFCLGVPDEQNVKDGGQRMLIRRAMEGILPPEVQWNTLRGKQAADAAFRLRRNAGEMEAILERLERHARAASYLDLPLMRRVWNELAENVTPRTSWRAATLLLRGIMCGCFLEGIEKYAEEW